VAQKVVYKRRSFAKLRWPYTPVKRRPDQNKKRAPHRSKVTQIDQNTPYRLCTRRSPSEPVASANFSIEPSKFLASMLASTASAVSFDMNRGVVSLVKQRRIREAQRPNLDEFAREARVTLTKAITLRAGMAESHADVEAAHQLVRQRYAWRGYDIPDARPARLLAENKVIFVAKDGDDAVGTITLGLDGHSGLLAEGTYPEAIAERRAAGANVCEVTRLAVAEQAESKPVLAALFSLAYATAHVRGVTDVFVEVNPRHVVFYRRVLGFAVAAGEKFCERVKAPSVLLWLKMDELERRLRKLNASVVSLQYGDTAIAA